MRAPVFLLSTGRTGTRFLAEFFSTYGADVASHHTTSGTRRLNVLSNLAVLGLAPRRFADAWLSRTSIPAIGAEPRRWVECNPFYFDSVPRLRDWFPDARFVLVTRHPKGFCQSHIRWERQRPQSRVANQLVPFWAPVGYHEQLLGLLGHYRQRVRYYAKVWSRRNATILRHLEADPDAITLRFEDVFEAPDGAQRLAELLSTLEIEPLAPVDAAVLGRRVNQTAASGSAELWDASCDALLRRHCGPLMERFGYVV